MSRPLRIGREADAEMTAASRWYEGQRVGLGEEFMAAIDAALRLIESNPAVGSRPPGVKDEDVRRVLVRRFPYDVVYMELPDRIQVLAIAHERRRPGYWADRIQR